ncbi:hypothetical protein D9O50_10205 [Oxalobacteraceae bacterium CAVE-383]|nr:hypothetical protein D9O50_10205 [Oxalobacteraceae bacterium CAVE-383]
MTQKKFLYDPERQCYWFEISGDTGVVKAAVSFKTLQFNFKAVNNPASMRRACVLNEGLFRKIAALKLKRGDRPVIECFDPEIEDIGPGI